MLCKETSTQNHLKQWRTQFAGELHYGEKTKDQGGGGYKDYCRQNGSETAQNSSQCDNHLDKVKESTKTSEENKMVEAKRSESEEQIQNGSD